MRRFTALYLLLIAVLIGLPACRAIIRPAPPRTPTLTATVSLIPSVTPRPTFTDTPHPTWTPVPSLTPTSTPTATPTVTLTPTPGWCNPASLLVRTPQPAPVVIGRLRIVFLSGGDLWLWDEGGSASRLTRDGGITQVELSSDGHLAAYLRPASLYGSEIWLYDVSAGQATLLADQQTLARAAGKPDALGVDPYHLAWVPGRSRLAFNARPVWETPQEYVPDDLWLVEIPSGQVHSLLPAGQGGEFTFSPDGLNVAIAREDGLDLYGASGESPRRSVLPGYHAVGMGSINYYPKPFWARDSQSLRLGLEASTTAENPNPEVNLWEIPVQGVRPVLRGTVNALPPSVSFSPDLSRAAYLDWQDLTPRIKVLGLADTSAPAFLSQVYQPGLDLEFLGWSPDSEHFAFYLPSVLGLRLGGLCSADRALGDTPARPGAFKWVDSARFLYTGGLGGRPSLRLGQVDIDASSQEIGPLDGIIDFEFALVE